ncbi:hypothetical protein [Sphingomonas soli]|uniref:hypothetical protein n=1 Tax=Sphingomonas soli TaxID=266127 RepID=UPI00082DB816|nr:hypothetical protein [Sphingomonas soli]
MAIGGRTDLIAFAAAGAVAVVMPLALLMPGRAVPLPERAPAPVPISVTVPPPLASVYARPLFGAAQPDESAVPANAPELIGIVGRLGEDAVALVRSGGASRTLRIGDSVDGWKLESLSIDAAFFTRGAERARVPLPAG